MSSMREFLSNFGDPDDPKVIAAGVGTLLDSHDEGWGLPTFFFDPNRQYEITVGANAGQLPDDIAFQWRGLKIGGVRQLRGQFTTDNNIFGDQHFHTGDYVVPTVDALRALAEVDARTALWFLENVTNQQGLLPYFLGFQASGVTVTKQE